MKSLEIRFKSINTDTYAKNITATLNVPDRIDADTGVMLATHGWGGNRFQHVEQMALAAEQYNVIAVGTEYRLSGYDFDPVTGRGASLPYDGSFYQVFDVLNALRTVLELYPNINRKRLFHYGGSQGGHIALLSAVFAPGTFAWVYASCPVVYLDDYFKHRVGRIFSEAELAIRDLRVQAKRITCPVFLEYGTADETVNCDRHSRVLIDTLSGAGNAPAKVHVYEGGGHSLQPTITKIQAFERMAPEPLKTMVRHSDDDFITGSTVAIPCGSHTLRIDWSKAADDSRLFTFGPE